MPRDGETRCFIVMVKYNCAAPFAVSLRDSEKRSIIFHCFLEFDLIFLIDQAETDPSTQSPRILGVQTLPCF